MNKFSAYPFLRITPVFILGIVVFHYCSDYFNFSPVFLIVLIMLFILLGLKDALKFDWLIGILAVGILFFFGYFRLQYFKDDFNKEHLLHSKNDFQAYRATIIEPPENKANSIKTVVSINEIYVAQNSERRVGKVVLYVDKVLGGDLKYGDQLLIQGRPNLLKGPLNPGEFDYRNYLIYNNTFHQHFAGQNFLVLGNEPPSNLMLHAFRLRDDCHRIITKMIDNVEARSVVLALVLGIKDELDLELRNAYSAAGAMHVLAVSGLHVGIIYGIILMLFKRLGLNNKKRRWQLAVVSIGVLWLYAFVTGLSPSVLRAVTMFSFVAIGKASKRSTNIYNTLAASAFVLLWYNPYLIMSVGFQLSYLAVFGIVYLQPKFYSLLTLKSPLLNKVWAITCVSLAAQIATGPLSVLYFHQFPSYFFVSNLFIIPAAIVILVLGIIVISFSWVPILGELMAWLLELIVKLTNGLVFGVEAIPGSVIQGVNFKTHESWLLYFGILSLVLLFAKKKFKYMMLATTLTFLFAISQIQERRKFNQSSHVSFFDMPNSAVIDFNNGSTSRLVGDTSILNNKDKLRFNIVPKRLTSYQSIDIGRDGLELITDKIPGAELTVFEGVSFLLIHDAEIRNFSSTRKIPINNIILSKEAISELSQLTELFEFEKLIIDGSNRKYLVDKLTIQAEALNLDVHSIYENGYLQIKMSK